MLDNLGLYHMLGSLTKSKVSHVRLESFYKLKIFGTSFSSFKALCVSELYTVYCTLTCRLHDPPLFGELNLLPMVVKCHSYFNGLPLVFLYLYSLAAKCITVEPRSTDTRL